MRMGMTVLGIAARAAGWETVAWRLVQPLPNSFAKNPGRSVRWKKSPCLSLRGKR
jgi:hypothetical protein